MGVVPLAAAEGVCDPTSPADGIALDGDEAACMSPEPPQAAASRTTQNRMGPGRDRVTGH